MKPPLSVILICLLFILSGILGIIYHAADWKEIPFRSDDIWVTVIRLLAIAGGVFAWRGSRWARWLLALWMGYHVVLSFYHTTGELIIHVVLMVVTCVALFNRKANIYFQKLI